MSNNNMIGDADGIKLWQIMAASTDKIEKEYFGSLNNAASKHGRVWFSDIITQMRENKNQTIWQMIWNPNDSQWVVSLFHIPEGVKKVSDRIAQYGEKEVWVELDANDIIGE